MSEKLNPFDLAKNINGHAEPLDVSLTGYEPFVMNVLYSNTIDSVLFSNEMNQHWNLPKQMQYDFYRHGLPKNMRRYGKWNKKEKRDEDISQIQEAFGYSRNKAFEVWPILKGSMDEVRKRNEKGGRK